MHVGHVSTRVRRTPLGAKHGTGPCSSTCNTHDSESHGLSSTHTRPWHTSGSTYHIRGVVFEGPSREAASSSPLTTIISSFSRLLSRSESSGVRPYPLPGIVSTRDSLTGMCRCMGIMAEVAAYGKHAR